MSKKAKTTTAVLSSASGCFLSRSSGSQELAEMKRVADYLRKNPTKLRELAVEMGIHTKTGRLTKAYGG